MVPECRLLPRCRSILPVLAAAVLCGCVPIRDGVLRESSTTPPMTLAENRIGRAAAPRAAATGESASILLDNGRQAWLHRAALIDAAERSIDLQYYIYERDDSGIALMYRALLAADRGVRVRLLLDDSALSTEDLALATLDAHPHIEVRVFNAYHNRVRATRFLELLSDFDRLQRRMHNKLLVVDGAAAICGGRNIGDNYFDVDGDTNFEDVDLLVIGPAAGEAAVSFDDYWNSPYAVPAAALVKEPPGEQGLAIARATLTAPFERAVADAERYVQARDEVLGRIERLEDAIWAPVHLLVDSPSKVDPATEPQSPLLDGLQDLLTNAHEEVLLASAYFVPRRDGAKAIIGVRQRGVRVAVLTNSLAATDVPVVHAGYLKYRRRLAKGGVELYEYRRAHDLPRAPGDKRKASSGASLHTKSLVVDGRYAWIGSFNLDPRSALLNTELAFVVDSPELAGRLAQRLQQSMVPERSWRVEWTRDGLRWSGLKGGETVTYDHDPGVSFFSRVGVKALSYIPGIEDLL